MVYPVDFSTFTTKTNKTGVVEGGETNRVYASHINDLQDAVERLETKVGLDGSSDPVSLDFEAADLRADLTVAEASIVTLDGRLDTAEPLIATAGTDIIALDGRLDTAESDINTVEATVATHLTPANAILTGLDASKPSASIQGRIWIATDTGAHYRDSGSVWTMIHPVSSAGFTPSTTAGAEGYDTTTRRWRSWDGLQIGNFERVLTKPAPNASDTLTASVISTVDTAFATTQALPAAFLIAGKVLRVSAIFGITTSGSPPTVRLRLKLLKAGPTLVTLWRSPVMAPTINLADIGGGVVWVFQANAAPGAAVGVEAGAVTGTFAGVAGFYNTLSQPITTDTASAQTIEVTVEYGANTALNSITLRQLFVEEL